MHASHTRRCAALAAAVQQGLLTDDSPSAMLMDLDQVDSIITHVQSEAGYPATALHTVAVKANPVGRILKVFQGRGMGAEVSAT